MVDLFLNRLWTSYTLLNHIIIQRGLFEKINIVLTEAYTGLKLKGNQQESRAFPDEWMTGPKTVRSALKSKLLFKLVSFHAKACHQQINSDKNKDMPLCKYTFDV